LSREQTQGHIMVWRLLAFGAFGLLVAILVIVVWPYVMLDDAKSPENFNTTVQIAPQLAPTAAEERSSEAAIDRRNPDAGSISPPDQPTAAASAPAGMSPGERARQLVNDARKGNTELTLEVLFSRAEEFQQAGHLTDAHILLFFIARQGYPAAARELAAMYDPLTFSPQTSMMDEPFPSQAYKWYKKAAEAGDGEAAERLRALRQWVETAAERGDAEAQRLLLQWQ